MGQDLRIGQFPWWGLRLAAPFWELGRELMEMRYLYTTPHSLDPAPMARLLPDFRGVDFDTMLRAHLPARPAPRCHPGPRALNLAGADPMDARPRAVSLGGNRSIRTGRHARHRSHRPARRLSLVQVAAIAGIGAVLHLAQDLFLPVALAILITFALAPGFTRLRRTGLPDLPAVLSAVASPPWCWPPSSWPWPAS